MAEYNRYPPGPYSYSPQRGTPGQCMVAQVWDRDGKALATVEPRACEGEATAAARLLAAAPEMFDALEQLHEHDVEMHDAYCELCNPSHVENCPWLREIAQVKGLIDRVLGIAHEEGGHDGG